MAFKVRRNKRYRPFSSLSLSKRSDFGFKLSRKIARDRPIYGGHFTSNYLLIEPESPSICNQWFDFLFIGAHKYDVWSASIVTAKSKFWGMVETSASNEAYDLLALGPGERLKGRKKYPQLGNLKFSEYTEKREREIIATDPPDIFEYFQLKRSYVYGIGLEIVVAAETLSYPLIDQVIDRFLTLGQKNWQSDKPVPRHLLPFETNFEAISTSGPLLFFGLPIRDDFSVAYYKL